VLENNRFAQLVMLNTDVKHLPADIFQTPAFTLEVDQSKQFTGLSDATHIGNADPTGGISINGVEILPLVVRDNPGTPGPHANYLHYTGKETVVLGGTEGNDIMIARSSDDDTVYGDGGKDRIDGGFGNDNLFGGAGDYIITRQVRLGAVDEVVPMSPGNRRDVVPGDDEVLAVAAQDDVREFEGHQGMAIGNDVIAVVAVNNVGAAHVA
jgi:Ca2+-binding RTX toxin-like protein